MEFTYSLDGEHAVVTLNPESGESRRFDVRGPRKCAYGHHHLAIASNDEKRVIVLGFDGNYVHSVRHTSAVRAIHFFHSKPWLVSGDDNGVVKITDLATKTTVRSFNHHSNAIADVFVSRLDSFVFATSMAATNNASVWQASTLPTTSPIPVMMLHGHTYTVYAIICFHDEMTCATGSGDGTIKVWEHQTGLCKATLEQHSNLVLALALHHKQDLFASGSRDETVIMWSIATLAPLQRIKCDGGVRSLCFLPSDGIDVDRILVGVTNVRLVEYRTTTQEKLRIHGAPVVGEIFGICVRVKE